MPLDPRIAAYLEKNKEWANSSEYVKPIPFLEMQKKGREREDGTIIVVACTDPRVTPEEFLGMSAKEGNKATIVRTAGGRVKPALSTLLVLSAVGNLGKKGVIMVVHHTDCGLQTADDGAIREALANAASGIESMSEEGVVSSGEGGKEGDNKQELESMEFGSFKDPEESVKADVQWLREGKWFKGCQILGFVQDTERGVLREVVGS